MLMPLLKLLTIGSICFCIKISHSVRLAITSHYSLHNFKLRNITFILNTFLDKIYMNLGSYPRICSVILSVMHSTNTIIFLYAIVDGCILFRMFHYWLTSSTYTRFELSMQFIVSVHYL